MICLAAKAVKAQSQSAAAVAGASSRHAGSACCSIVAAGTHAAQRVSQRGKRERESEAEISEAKGESGVSAGHSSGNVRT